MEKWGLPPPHPQQDEHRRPRWAPRRRFRSWILFCTWYVLRFSLWIGAIHVRCSRRERTKVRCSRRERCRSGGCRPHTPNTMNAAAPGNTGRAPPLDPVATVRSPRIRSILQKMAPRRRSRAWILGGIPRIWLQLPAGKDEIQCCNSCLERSRYHQG